MLTVNIHTAKTQLSRLVEQASRGEAFIIAKAGKPMVKVVPLNRPDAGAAGRPAGLHGGRDRRAGGFRPDGRRCDRRLVRGKQGLNLLLDTHLLLWAASAPERLSAKARKLLLARNSQLLFSSASLWEIVIKRSLGRADFNVDPRRLWRLLLVHGYREVSVTSEHVVAVQDLPPIHNDPFDRILVTQARLEGLQLLTVDRQVAGYGAGIRRL